MTAPDRPTPTDATAALSIAEQARSAGSTPGRVPAWFPPTRALLFAAGLGLCIGPWSRHPWIFAIGLLDLLVLVLVHVIAVRRLLVLARPAGSPGRRFLLQSCPMLAYGVGWLTALPFGAAVGAVVAAVAAGVTLWVTGPRAGTPGTGVTR